jgi:hypothetical protein
MTGALFELDGESVISVAEPEAMGGPFRIYAHLRDKDGSRILDIDANVWRTPGTSWDVEVVKRHIKIRCAARKFSLVLRQEPPQRIVVERLEMVHRGTNIRCAEGKEIEVVTPDGRTMRSGDSAVEECAVGIKVTQDAIMLGVAGAARSTISMGRAELQDARGRPLITALNSVFTGDFLGQWPLRQPGHRWHIRSATCLRRRSAGTNLALAVAAKSTSGVTDAEQRNSRLGF